MTYEEAIERMHNAACDAVRHSGDEPPNRGAIVAAAEAIGLREMMEVLNEPFLPDFPPGALPDPNYVFKCPISFAGCVKNCGDYGCGN